MAFRDFREPGPWLPTELEEATHINRSMMTPTRQMDALYYATACLHLLSICFSRKSRESFGPEKQVVKLQSACFEKLIF